MQTSTLLALAMSVSCAVAQCPFQTVAVQTYGQGCNAVFAALPTLTFALDASACQLTANVSSFPGCCNTFRVGSLLALGDQPVNVPLPQFGPGCTLLASPAILLFVPNAAGTSFALNLPPALPPLTFHGQGGVLYFTTIGLSYDFALTEGAQVTLQ